MSRARRGQGRGSEGKLAKRHSPHHIHSHLISDDSFSDHTKMQGVLGNVLVWDTEERPHSFSGQLAILATPRLESIFNLPNSSIIMRLMWNRTKNNEKWVSMIPSDLGTRSEELGAPKKKVPVSARISSTLPSYINYRCQNVVMEIWGEPGGLEDRGRWWSPSQIWSLPPGARGSIRSRTTSAIWKKDAARGWRLTDPLLWMLSQLLCLYFSSKHLHLGPASSTIMLELCLHSLFLYLYSAEDRWFLPIPYSSNTIMYSLKLHFYALLTSK